MKCEHCGGEVDEDGMTLMPVEEEEQSAETDVPPEVVDREFVAAMKERR